MAISHLRLVQLLRSKPHGSLWSFHQSQQTYDRSVSHAKLSLVTTILSSFINKSSDIEVSIDSTHYIEITWSANVNCKMQDFSTKKHLIISIEKSRFFPSGYLRKHRSLYPLWSISECVLCYRFHYRKTPSACGWVWVCVFFLILVWVVYSSKWATVFFKVCCYAVGWLLFLFWCIGTAQ